MTGCLRLDAMPANERPILIFGAPRSGTSLLSRLLNAHSRIAIPFESHLFNQWGNRAQCYGDLSEEAAQSRLVADIIAFGVVRDWTPLPRPKEVMGYVRGPGFGAIASAFMYWSAASQGKPRWGEKTPHHTLLHDDVLRAWNDAVVIIIERDPRDVALSWKRARFGGSHVLPFARAWVRYAEACETVRRNLPGARVFDVNYETLVTSPHETLERLMVSLGETFEPEQLAFHRSGECWQTDNRNQQKLQTPISDQSVGLWQSGLSAREISLVETITGHTMERRGYAATTTGPPMSAAQLAAAQWVGYPIGRLLGVTRNARGFSYLGRDLAWRLRDFGGRRLMAP